MVESISAESFPEKVLFMNRPSCFMSRPAGMYFFNVANVGWPCRRVCMAHAGLPAISSTLRTVIAGGIASPLRMSW